MTEKEIRNRFSDVHHKAEIVRDTAKRRLEDDEQSDRLTLYEIACMKLSMIEMIYRNIFGSEVDEWNKEEM